VYPQVFSKGKWYGICGHYFWNNNNGANSFCKKLGYNGGTLYKARKKLSYDAMMVGDCRANEPIGSCTGGGTNHWGNPNGLSGRCKAYKEGVGVTITCSGGSGTSSSCVDPSAGFVKFYSCGIGKAKVISHFELASSKSSANCFFKRLPAGATKSNTKIQARVSGGKCGGTGLVEFGLNDKMLSYLRDGKQGAWQAIPSPRKISGYVKYVPNKMWTGSGSNRGWILAKDQKSYMVLPRAMQ
jgi:hypothetical protein